MDEVPIRCRIPELARRIGKDQQWLADKLGMSKQQMSDYVNLRFIPRLPTLRNIAILLHVHIEDLYVWERRGE